MLLPGNVSEKPRTAATAGIFPLLPYTIKFEKLQGAPAPEGCARSYVHALQEQQSLSSQPRPCQSLPPWSYRHEDRWATQTCLPVLPSKSLWHDQMVFCVCLVEIRTYKWLQHCQEQSIPHPFWQTLFQSWDVPSHDDGYLLEIHQRGKNPMENISTEITTVSEREQRCTHVEWW